MAAKRPGPAITVPLAAPPKPESKPETVPPAAEASSEAGAPSESTLPAPPSDDEPFLPGIMPEAETAAAAAAPSDAEPRALVAGKSSEESLTSASRDAASVAAGAASSIAAPAAAGPQSAPSPVAIAAEGEPSSEPPPVASDGAATVTAGVSQETGEISTAPEPNASEPELIEVWRQQRSVHPRPRAHVHGQGAGEKHARRRHDRGPRADGPLNADAVSPSEKATQAEGRREEGRPQRDNRAHAGGRPPRRDKRHGSRPEHGAERQKREEAARPHAGAQRPDKRPQKAIDPDNPFAKLMALKAQMEEEGQR